MEAQARHWPISPWRSWLSPPRSTTSTLSSLSCRGGDHRSSSPWRISDRRWAPCGRRSARLRRRRRRIEPRRCRRPRSCIWLICLHCCPKQWTRSALTSTMRRTRVTRVTGPLATAFITTHGGNRLGRSAPCGCLRLMVRLNSLTPASSLILRIVGTIGCRPRLVLISLCSTGQTLVLGGSNARRTSACALSAQIPGLVVLLCTSPTVHCPGCSRHMLTCTIRNGVISQQRFFPSLVGRNFKICCDSLTGSSNRARLLNTQNSSRR